MPRVGKQALGQFIRTGCLRQLRLNLTPDTRDYQGEREAAGMPKPLPPRPGTQHLREAGEAWQAEKIAELMAVFGPAVVVGVPRPGSVGPGTFQPGDLRTLLEGASPGSFLVEAEFEVGGAFEAALGIAGYRSRYNLGYERLRPDLIEVLPGESAADRYITPAGELAWLPAGDRRQRLRVIDIKLTAEPSPAYFAEVAYYSMALAGWLIDHGLGAEYVVVPEAAVWPGSHEASRLVTVQREAEAAGRTPSDQELRKALAEDLEVVPFAVFADRVRQFFVDDLPGVLELSWRDLPWHVDRRCIGCDYLGYVWRGDGSGAGVGADHCMPAAERRGHLSRVAFLSPGAAAALAEQGVVDVAGLAKLAPDSPVFDGHHVLRASRRVLAARAQALQAAKALVPQGSGTSAVMPKWADLHVYLTVHFDVGSAITLALGLQGFWMDPDMDGSGQRATHAYRPPAFVVDQRDPAAERRELLAFLKALRAMLDDAAKKNPSTTFQVYLWDTLQYKHFARIIGRHLAWILQDPAISDLAWLFPPEELLPNPDQETRRSPITIVSEVVRAIVAAPVPHAYTLLEVARHYHHRSLRNPDAALGVRPLFVDPLSDQIPSERAHEIWTRATRPHHWSTQLRVLEDTIGIHLGALQTITRRLEADLKPVLRQQAPPIQVGPPKREPGISVDGQLWLGFARLDAALGELDVYQVRAMPPEEREARYRSARLRRRLVGGDEAAALAALQISPQPGLRVYELREASREVKLREGDFTFALAPEREAGFLDRTLGQVTRGTPLNPADWPARQTPMDRVTAVSVVAIDRDAGLIALAPDRQSPITLEDLERHGLADFSRDVILDPRWVDTYTRKLRETLRAIGNPSNARDHPLVRRAVGLVGARRRRVTAVSPVAEVLWSAPALAQAPVGRNILHARQVLAVSGVTLNASQEAAWEAALTRRLQLIWGPPGTGKSRTLRAVALGAVADAAHRGVPFRLLICGPTYQAVDTVLRGALAMIEGAVPGADVRGARLRSHYQPREQQVDARLDVEVNRANPSDQLLELRERLRHSEGITVVGATPEQVHNLLVARDGKAQDELFDLIILDEASQLDVGHAILALAALASGGAVVVAGDPLQLPPIHRAKPPAGLEEMVGSVYTFFQDLHGLQPASLDVNYRSNQVIVELAHEAGYQRSLQSHEPDRRIALVTPVPARAPDPWPDDLLWTPEWVELLDPERPVVCFVYSEGRSGQWNRFEAQSVATLLYLLAGRLADPGTPGTAYRPDGFWQRGVGVVTPHRAQQALVVSTLQRVFEPLGVAPGLIRAAVDTVERFQGQERDIMIASFALGDPDAIADEDEFLLSLNRFNVMASRARAKVVIFVSRELLSHLSVDLEVLRASRLLKGVVGSFCGEARPMTLGYRDGGEEVSVSGTFRWRAWPRVPGTAPVSPPAPTPPG